MIEGYKCFNADFTNQYGKKFEVGKIYTATGKIKFKNKLWNDKICCCGRCESRIVPVGLYIRSGEY